MAPETGCKDAAIAEEMLLADETAVAEKEFDPAQALQRSVQQEADTANPANAATSMILWSTAAMADGFMPWGQLPKARDRQLREFWPSETFLASALATVTARNAGFEWVLEGDDLSVQRAQEILVNSEYGRGWQHLWIKECIDLYSQDMGAFVQIIRQKKGDPLSPIVNLTHLDSWRCYPTGKAQQPVAYLDRKNKWHMLEWYEVRNLLEMPSPVESVQAGTFFELQYSAVTRVLKAAQILRDITTYNTEKVAGRFLRGIHIVGGVAQKELQDAIDGQRAMVDQAGLLRYMQPLIISTLDPNSKVSHELIEMASLPTGWDEEKTNKMYVMALAMAFLTDYQEFAPLPGGGLGTSAQSDVLKQKSLGKGPAVYKGAVAHFMNNGGILPQNVTFKWVEQDIDADKAKADTALVRAQTRNQMVVTGELDPEGARQIAVEDGDMSADLAMEIQMRDVQREAEAAAQAAVLAAQPKISAPASGAPNPTTAQGDQPSDNQNPATSTASQKMLSGLIDLITMDVKDDERRLTLGAFLQTRIHKAFTMAADDLAALGYMDTAGRIALSQVIGDTLREFSELSTGQDASEDVFTICMQTLNGEDVGDLVKSVAKALRVPPGRKKAESVTQSIVQSEFDDIWEKVAERLAGARLKAVPVVEKRKRTRTKVLRDDRGAISETVTEEI